MRNHLATIIEAIHAEPDAALSTWLDNVLSATEPVLDRGLGIISMVYSAPTPEDFKIDVFAHRGTSENVLPALGQLESKLDKQYVAESFCKGVCQTASQVPFWSKLGALRSELSRFGIHDALAINGKDNDGTGVVINAFRNKEGIATPEEQKVWERIAQNLSASKRVRSLILGGKAHASAVFDQEAKPLHLAESAQAKNAADQLQHAVKELERLKLTRIPDADDLFRVSKPKLLGRFTVFHQFDNAGRRFYVVYEDVSTPHLTARELQVLEKAALGLSNKEIAFELELKHSTVRVLLSRAMARVGVQSREELIEFFRQSALQLANGSRRER